MKKRRSMTPEGAVRVFQFIDNLMADGEALRAWAEKNNPPPLDSLEIGDKVELVRFMFGGPSSLPTGSVGVIVELVDPEDDGLNPNLWAVDFNDYDEGLWHMEEGEIKRHVPDQPAPGQQGGQG